MVRLEVLDAIWEVLCGEYVYHCGTIGPQAKPDTPAVQSMCRSDERDGPRCGNACEPPASAACGAQPSRRSLRDAPPPRRAVHHRRGAQRAPLAKAGTLPALEACVTSVKQHASRAPFVRDVQAPLSDGLPPIPRAAAAPAASTEFGGGRKRAARRASTARWGQPQSCVRVTVPRVRIPPSPQLFRKRSR